ncbi:hypothetical protein [Helicobacter sp. MIT 05-5294]|uniref:hypothetical protein n=1 Tax=Helicobacter sp. MIT 05-5294 TaxID=1548150 RepID=UPI00051F91EF|nr:hypothetical protein [Helicobacter sp. MIT 05-5294]TLD85469.1 hypothetical protein LS69_009375 [Helicobacter sp. MIT 05-5294]
MGYREIKEWQKCCKRYNALYKEYNKRLRQNRKNPQELDVVKLLAIRSVGVDNRVYLDYCIDYQRLKSIKGKLQDFLGYLRFLKSQKDRYIKSEVVMIFANKSHFGVLNAQNFLKTHLGVKVADCRNLLK